MSGFEDLKQSIRIKGRPRSPQEYASLLEVFTDTEKSALLVSQRIIAEGSLGNDLEVAVELAMRLVMKMLDYTLDDAAYFLRLGEDLISRLPECPEILARMAAYFD